MATYLGSLIHPTQGNLSFLTAVLPKGWLQDIAMAEEETLKSPGVGGIRWRTTSLQHEADTLSTYFDCASYAAAVIQGQIYKRCKDGQAVSITIQAGGNTYTYKNVHLLSVQPTAFIGTLVGLGVTGALAHTTCDWGVQLMDTTVTGQVGLS